MRALIVILLLAAGLLQAQVDDSTFIPTSGMLKGLKDGDSIVYYQCHVEEAVQQLSTASGQTLTAASQKFSITEKFVIHRHGTEFKTDYYSASLTVFPNRKFSALKIREKSYWGFKKENTVVLTARQLKTFAALENKGHEAIEYDYAITRYNTNQLIVKHGKDFKQLVIEGNYILSKLIKQ